MTSTASNYQDCHVAQRHWVDADISFIAHRYDCLAALIPVFDWIFFFPRHLRDLAAMRLGVQWGARVLELGCGTGRNFHSLQRVVGPEGSIDGVDISAGMLARAHDLCKRESWTNVELVQCDAAQYVPPEPIDAILFGLSYNTMPHHRLVLQHAWTILHPGSRIVIMDGKAPGGRMGKFFLPFGSWIMKRTLLGNPFIAPWEHLAALAHDFGMQEFVFGSWYVCWGLKQAGNRNSGESTRAASSVEGNAYLKDGRRRTCLRATASPTSKTGRALADR